MYAWTVGNRLYNYRNTGDILGLSSATQKEGEMVEVCEPIKINELGMELDGWSHKSCSARCGVGKDWATVYHIGSREESKGHATELLLIMKKYYEGKGLKFGGSVALNDRMHRIYQRCGVKEYTELT